MGFPKTLQNWASPTRDPMSPKVGALKVWCLCSKSSGAVVTCRSRKTLGRGGGGVPRPSFLGCTPCPWGKIVSVQKTLGAPHPIDFLLHTPGSNDLIGSRVNLKEKLQLMWQHNPPVTQGNEVVVGISIDGTKL